ncbi:MAG TPA: single-stranded DNA-binding protein [Phycisphaerae bacterium]|nr:single-stranded DNA-binding protein [Phycisphaerae bacterium]
MANFNKIILVGNLTRDPQLSYLPSQTPVVEFGLAVNRNWTAQDGQKREETCFIDCRAYGRQAETINRYLAKGRQALVEGRLQFDTWEGQDGQRRSKHRVFVERCQFLGGAPVPGRAAPAPASSQYPQPPGPAPEPAPQQPGGPAPQPAPQQTRPPETDGPPPSSYDGDLGVEEDIPF